MSNRTKFREALVYSAGLALVLVLLGVLPEFIRPKRFGFLLKDLSHAPSVSFPVERKFRTVASQASRERSVADIAGPQGLALVNFWATWCPPCIDELPSLEFLNRQLKQSKDASKMPRIVAVSVDEKPSDIPRLFKSLDFAPSLEILSDPKGDLAVSLGTRKYPETLLVNAKGDVLHKWVGPQDWLSAEVLDTIKRFAN